MTRREIVGLFLFSLSFFFFLCGASRGRGIRELELELNTCSVSRNPSAKTGNTVTQPMEICHGDVIPQSSYIGKKKTKHSSREAARGAL